MLWDTKLNIKKIEEIALRAMDNDLLLDKGLTAAKKLAAMFHNYADWWDAKVAELEQRKQTNPEGDSSPETKSENSVD